jgi:hypothetical protein
LAAALAEIPAPSRSCTAAHGSCALLVSCPLTSTLLPTSAFDMVAIKPNTILHTYRRGLASVEARRPVEATAQLRLGICDGVRLTNRRGGGWSVDNDGRSVWEVDIRSCLLRGKHSERQLHLTRSFDNLHIHPNTRATMAAKVRFLLQLPIVCPACIPNAIKAHELPHEGLSHNCMASIQHVLTLPSLLLLLLSTPTAAL